MSTIENKGAKYSEMIIELVNTFDEKVPEKLTFEDVIEMTIEAWNLANNRKNLGEKAYQNMIKNHQLSDVLHEMVEYKLKHFAGYTNIIVDFSTEGDRLQIKSQKLENLFDGLLKRVINSRPEKKEKL